MLTIGFVGLGNVGEAMTQNLLASGHGVVGFDVRHNPRFVERGGRHVFSIAELVQALPPKAAILHSVPNEAALQDTISALASCDAAHGMRLVDISSYRLEAKRDAAARLAQHGIDMLDCEVSGLPPLVAQRKATIFKSGDEAVVDSLADLFDAIAERHVFLGEFGAATKMKLIANTMVCVHNLMAAEAIALGRRAGIDPALLFDALNQSAAGSATFTMKGPLMLSRNFDEGRGPFVHMFSYLARASEMARHANAVTPLLDLAKAIYQIAEKEGRHQQDIAAIVEVVERIDPSDQFARQQAD